MAGCGCVRVITSRQRVRVSDTSYMCLRSHVRRCRPGEAQVRPAERRRGASPPSRHFLLLQDAVAAVGNPQKINKENPALRQCRLSHESSPIINFTLFFFGHRRWAGGNAQTLRFGPSVWVSGCRAGAKKGGKEGQTKPHIPEGRG